MSNKPIKILLLVEDNPGDARLLREMFNEQGAHNTELTHAECMGDAEKHLAQRYYDIILLDLGLPDAQGLGALRARLSYASLGHHGLISSTAPSHTGSYCPTLGEARTMTECRAGPDS